MPDSPKNRFLKRINSHLPDGRTTLQADMLGGAMLQDCIDVALLQMVHVQGHPLNNEVAAINGHRLAGVKQFIDILQTLADKPAQVKQGPPPGNLNEP